MKSVERRKQALELIKKSQKITFLTGAGVSVPSGIPDYRSINGLYHELEHPEYLLSHECLMKEPEKHDQFIKKLYHLEAKPNHIHQKIAQLELSTDKQIEVVTQNIDQLHRKAGSQNLTEFHGSLMECYCLKCKQQVSVSDYLSSSYHENCGGHLRTNVVLYGEALHEKSLGQAISAVENADLIVIVGTSFQVHPFCDLIFYRKANAQVIVVNQEAISLPVAHFFIKGDATDFFQEIMVD